MVVCVCVCVEPCIHCTPSTLLHFCFCLHRHQDGEERSDSSLLFTKIGILWFSVFLVGEIGKYSTMEQRGKLFQLEVSSV